MFVELLNRLSNLARTLTSSQSASEKRILAAIAALDTKITDIVREQITQRFLLLQILDAVTLPPATKAILTFEVEGVTVAEGEQISMKVPINSKGTLTVTLNGKVDGVPVWGANPDGIVTLTPAADGLSCEVVTPPAMADPTAVVITFTADGDLGEGVKPVSATGTLTIFDPATGATNAEMSIGEFTPIG